MRSSSMTSSRSSMGRSTIRRVVSNNTISSNTIGNSVASCTTTGKGNPILGAETIISSLLVENSTSRTMSRRTMISSSTSSTTNRISIGMNTSGISGINASISLTSRSGNLTQHLTQQTRQNSSFMKRVLDQIQKDLEKNEEYQKNMKKVQEDGNADTLKQKALEQEERLRKMKEAFSTTQTKTNDYFRAMKQSAEENQKKLGETMSKQTEENEFLKKSKEMFIQAKEAVGIETDPEKAKYEVEIDPETGKTKIDPETGKVVFKLDPTTGERILKKPSMFSKAFTGTKEVFSGGIQKMNEAFSTFDGEKAKGHQAWKEQQGHMRALKKQMAEEESKSNTKTEELNSDGTTVKTTLVDGEGTNEGINKTDAEGTNEGINKTAETKVEDEAPKNALVIKHSSNWERFGASVRDMPLLSSVFDNPFFDRIMGETEIAQSVREMKDIDRSFSIMELTEEVETVIAPILVKSYIEGNVDFLKLHLGESAFMRVHAGIKERVKQNLYLDNDIREGPLDIELKGAKCAAEGAGNAPTFVFTFTCQQINCLRDEEGEIVEGAIDDIRNVIYAACVTRHPFCEEEYIAEMERQKKKAEEFSSGIAEEEGETSKNKETQAQKSEQMGDQSDLEFPWLITEFAILGQQQVW